MATTSSQPVSFLSKSIKTTQPSTYDELQQSLNELSQLVQHDIDSIEYANAVDKLDTLHKYRSQFYIPPNHQQHNTSTVNSNTADNVTNGISKLSTNNTSNGNNNDSIYLCGNSLGLQPRLTYTAVNEELSKWADVGVEGHFEGSRPWAKIDELSTELTVDIVGAKYSSEIAIMNTLSANLHLLLLAFYQPTKQRYKVLIEQQAFCSDWHVIASQVQYHGYTVQDAVTAIEPRQNETYLRTEDIIKTIQDNSDSLALIMLPGIQFYTGQFFDIKTITQVGHDVGAIVGWDLAHAVGNVTLQLHDWNVDFAAWCTYKYLNSGPGAIAGLFVHSRHDDATINTHQQDSNVDNLTSLKRLSGWWGQDASIRFQMFSTHKPKKGAQSFMLSNPPVLPTVCLESSLKLFQQANIYKLRNKAIILTGYLEYLINKHLINNDNNKQNVRILTPTEPSQRGCQLSLFFNIDDITPVAKTLLQSGVIIDERRPNVIRIAPTPLYNTFTDVYQAVQILKDVLKQYKLIV